jgi:DnaK suppressor protein
MDAGGLSSADGQTLGRKCSLETKGALRDQLNEVTSRIQQLRKELREKPDYGLGKGDPMVTRWEMNRAKLERLTRKQVQLQAAVDRLANGTYGACERCGGKIHPDRIAVLPDTRLCIRCAQKEADHL